MDNVQLITFLLSAVAVVSNLLTYAATRAKYKSEIKVNAVTAALDAVELWEKGADLLKKEVAELSREVAREREVREKWQQTSKALQKNVEDLTREVRLLKQENARLRRFLKNGGIKLEDDE